MDQCAKQYNYHLYVVLCAQFYLGKKRIEQSKFTKENDDYNMEKRLWKKEVQK